jgi:CDP-4-dehydro-6-deoxyglucose reductase
MPNIRLNATASFSSEPGTSILDAASAASRSIAYSCRTGRCSTCRCKLVEGETAALAEESGLVAEEKAEGWILSCVRTAVTDVVLEVDTLDDLALPPPRMSPCRISGIEPMAPDVLRILLRVPPGSGCNHRPGQYIEVIGPGGIRRSYSLARTGPADQPLELHVREVAGGAMSDYWFQRARVNDLLRLHGPLGTFVLRDVAGIDLVLLATGTGIAPVKAILESLPALEPEQAPRSVTVLWGGRIPADLYLDVGALPGKHHFVPVLSRADAGWSGARGHVQDVLLNLRPDLRNAAVYACGSDAMIHGARDALLRAGLPAQRFHSDAFVCSAAPTIDQGR